ncbi:MAG: hypothetical protein ACYC6G_07550 [Desulfobaccales bacterium]
MKKGTKDRSGQSEIFFDQGDIRNVRFDAKKMADQQKNPRDAETPEVQPEA